MVSDQLLLLALAASAIALLSAVLAIVARARNISEQLSELDALSEKLKMISGSTDTRMALMQGRDDIEMKRQHTDEVKEITPDLACRNAYSTRPTTQQCSARPVGV